MNTRPFKLLGLLALLALQAAVPSVASWHALTAHHEHAAHAERASLSAHESEPHCPLCELARHGGERLQGPVATLLPPSFSACGTNLPECLVPAHTDIHTPYTPRAPPLL